MNDPEGRGVDEAGTDELGALHAPALSVPAPDPGSADPFVVVDPSDDGRVAVRGKAHRIAELSGDREGRYEKFRSLLEPDSYASGPDPGCADRMVVARRSDDGGVAVRGESNGRALQGQPDYILANELRSLLGPDPSAPAPDPRGTDAIAVDVPADDGCVAVGGNGYRGALMARQPRIRAGQWPRLLRPEAAVLRPDPCGAGGPVAVGPSDDGRVAVRRNGHAGPLQPGLPRTRPHQLRRMLHELSEGGLGREQRGG